MHKEMKEELNKYKTTGLQSKLEGYCTASKARLKQERKKASTKARKGFLKYCQARNMSFTGDCLVLKII